MAEIALPKDVGYLIIYFAIDNESRNCYLNLRPYHYRIMSRTHLVSIDKKCYQYYYKKNSCRILYKITHTKNPPESILIKFYEVLKIARIKCYNTNYTLETIFKYSDVIDMQLACEKRNVNCGNVFELFGRSEDNRHDKIKCKLLIKYGYNYRHIIINDDYYKDIVLKYTDLIFRYWDMTDKFIIENFEKFNWKKVEIRELSGKVMDFIIPRLDLSPKKILQNRNLTEETISRIYNGLSRITRGTMIKLSHMKNLPDHILQKECDWDLKSRYLDLDKLDKFRSKVDWALVSERNDLTEEFLKKYLGSLYLPILIRNYLPLPIIKSILELAYKMNQNGLIQEIILHHDITKLEIFETIKNDNRFKYQIIRHQPTNITDEYAGARLYYTSESIYEILNFD